MYRVIIGFFVITILGYMLCKPLLLFIIPSKYHEAFNYVLYILMGYIFWTGTYFNLGLIIFLKKVYFHAFSLLIPSCLNALLNILLIPSFKIYGCVTGSLLSYFFYFIITALYNHYLITTYLMQRDRKNNLSKHDAENYYDVHQQVPTQEQCT